MNSYRKTKKLLKLEMNFNAALCDLLVARFGAVVHATHDPSSGAPTALLLQTAVGSLWVYPYGSWVAMRFDDVERAKTRLPHRLGEGPLNPYSGKYNAVFNDELSVQARLDLVQNMIEKVI